MRADRLISLILILQRRGRRTCAELARDLEVSRRTVLRDIDALSVSGVPVLAEGGPGGGVWLRDDYRTSLTGMKDEELRALAISIDGSLLGDLGWRDAQRAGKLKLDAALPAASAPAVEFALCRILLDSRGWWPDESAGDRLAVLQESVFRDRVVEFRYERYDGRSGAVRAEAYALVAKSGTWYLVGKRKGELRCYRVGRMAGLADTGKPFARDAGFDIRAWWPGHAEDFSREFTSYRCVLGVSEEEARMIGHMAPGRVKILEKGKRTLVELRVESEWYASLVVLGIGGKCRIVEPAGLENVVLARARETIASLA